MPGVPARVRPAGGARLLFAALLALVASTVNAAEPATFVLPSWEGPFAPAYLPDDGAYPTRTAELFAPVEYVVLVPEASDTSGDTASGTASDTTGDPFDVVARITFRYLGSDGAATRDETAGAATDTDEDADGDADGDGAADTEGDADGDPSGDADTDTDGAPDPRSAAEAAETIVTEAFYDGAHEGAAVYRFRFTGTRLGVWAFASASDHPALDGLTGTIEVVPNEDDGVQGFLAAANGRFAWPVGNDGRVEGVAYHVFMHGGNEGEDLGRIPRREASMRAAIDALLDEVEENGSRALFVGVWNQWFQLGASRWDQHDSVHPDPATFRLLETMISRAHERGMALHIWQWGDEERRWTPLGVGRDVGQDGVNGVADQRLQRYIAARLGPLPNWTMAYGFDLHEWVTPDEVRRWASTMRGLLGWPHLLMAREQGLGNRDFDFAGEPLDVVSSDARPLLDGLDVYQVTLDELAAAAGRPVLFERRFLYLRDDVWTMDATRRTLWRMTMAGGAGSVWGVHWDAQEPYPEPHQLRIFRRFWQGRLDLELEPSRADDGTFWFVAPDGARGVAYGEDTDVLTLPPVGEGAVVVAVDTRGEAYEEVVVPLDAGAEASPAGEPWRWQAPHASDWAVAIGMTNAR
ncbi:MAG: hypothetical protein R6W77_07975 [Trueperaceae bacterium]